MLVSNYLFHLVIFLLIINQSISESFEKENNDQEVVSSDYQVEIFTQTFELEKLDLNSHQHNGYEIKGIQLVGLEWSKFKNAFLFSLFLLLTAFIKIVYHHIHFLNHTLPESCILIILGLIFGVAIHLVGLQHEVPKFTVNLFFYILLPPIILESAYSLHDHIFFANLGTIFLYAVAGTLMNLLMIGSSLYLFEVLKIQWMHFPKISFIELMIFATAISAVDPVSVIAIFHELSVNKSLYFLVFGESLFNDAVVIVIHRLMVALQGTAVVGIVEILCGIAAFFFVSFGGFAIGMFYGVITSLVTLSTSGVRVVEPMIMIVFAYLAFLTAETFHWSGIISIIGCGLVQAEYSFHNISNKSFTTVKYFTKTLSSISDLLIFFFLGTTLFNESHSWNTAFVLLSLIFCFVFRFISVFSLTFLANRFRSQIINIEEQILMAYGGLRGAVAFALIAVLNDEESIKNVSLFQTSTLFIILFTVFVMGSTTKPLLKFLRIRLELKKNLSGLLFDEINEELIHATGLGVKAIIGTKALQKFSIMEKWSKVNDKYIRKYLTKNKKTQKIEIIFRKLLFEDQKNWNFGNNNFIRRQSFAFKNNNLKTNKENVILEIDNLSDEENEINKINKKVISYTNKTLFNKLVKKLRIVIAIINVLKTHQYKRPKLLFRQKTNID